MARVIDLKDYRETKEVYLDLERRRANFDYAGWIKNIAKLLDELERKREEKSLEDEERAQKSREARRCLVEITYGEFREQKGFFTRYHRGGVDICIYFSKAYDRGGVTSFLESNKVRIPWKEILAGRRFEFEGILYSHVLPRIEEPGDNTSFSPERVLYFVSSSLDREHFAEPKHE